MKKYICRDVKENLVMLFLADGKTRVKVYKRNQKNFVAKTNVIHWQSINYSVQNYEPNQ